MPSIFSRKPCTRCWRACSPSVTISTPESSCSFTASMVASRLARASSSPDDFHGAHNLLGSASHSGFGSEPAIVVGNSMGSSRMALIWTDYLPCLAPHVHKFVMAGHRRAEATPSFGRLWPGHDDVKTSTATNSGLVWGNQEWRNFHDRPALRADAAR